LKYEFNLNNISELSLYLSESTLLIHYKYRLLNGK
jgi:hypothetical protein